MTTRSMLSHPASIEETDLTGMAGFLMAEPVSTSGSSSMILSARRSITLARVSPWKADAREPVQMMVPDTSTRSIWGA